VKKGGKLYGVGADGESEKKMSIRELRNPMDTGGVNEKKTG